MATAQRGQEPRRSVSSNSAGPNPNNGDLRGAAHLPQLLEKMSKVIGETIIADVHIESATKRKVTYDGQDRTEWALRVFIPSLGIKQYSTPVFMDAGWADDLMADEIHKVKLSRGRLKEGKDGNYDSNYFWNVLEWDTPDAPEPRRVEPARTPQGGYTQPLPMPDDTVTSIRMGQAANMATTLLTEFGVGFSGIDADWVAEIRYLRDKIYREILSVGVTPPHWCWSHNVPRHQRAKTGAWEHVLDDGEVCLEEQE